MGQVQCVLDGSGRHWAFGMLTPTETGRRDMERHLFGGKRGRICA